MIIKPQLHGKYHLLFDFCSSIDRRVILLDLAFTKGFDRIIQKLENVELFCGRLAFTCFDDKLKESVRIEQYSKVISKRSKV